MCKRFCDDFFKKLVIRVCSSFPFHTLGLLQKIVSRVRKKVEKKSQGRPLAASLCMTQQNLQNLCPKNAHDQ